MAVVKKKTTAKKKPVARKTTTRKPAARKPAARKKVADPVKKMASALQKQVDRIEKAATKRKTNTRKSSIFFVIQKTKTATKYFDGAGFTTEVKRAASWTDKATAIKVSRALANKLVKPVGVLSKKK